MNNIKLSILIPVYNMENKISICLDSLFNNKIIYNCEIIIVDDCSTDNSINVIKDYISNNKITNIILIQHKENKGLAVARQTAYLKSSGDYIICIDSDDWVESDFLDTLYFEAKKTNADIIGCDTYIDWGTISSIRCQNLKDNGRECLIGLLEDKIPGFVWIKMFKASIAKENKVTWIENINMCEDVLFSTQLFYYSSKVHYITKPLYHYVQNPGSYTNTHITLEKAQQLINCILFIENFLRDKAENELLETLKIRKIMTKLWILFKGKKEVQKKYLNLWPETLTIVSKIQMNFINKLMLKESINNPNLAFFLLRLRNKYVRIRDKKRMFN